MNLDSYEDLIHELTNWTSFSDPHVYDKVGMFYIFKSCIKNMTKHLNEYEVKELAEAMETEEREFLRIISRENGE